jgi:AcrR family transcriptional regulator
MTVNSTSDKILAAALSVFTEQGYESATIHEIRSRAGVSNGSLFHFFPTKQDISGALFAAGIAGYQQSMAETLRLYEADAEGGIRAVVRFHLKWIESHGNLAPFVFDRGRLDWSPDYSAAIQAANDSLWDVVARWAQPHIRGGRLKAMPSATFFACLVGPAQMVCRYWLASKSEAVPSQWASVLEEAAWTALEQPPGLDEPSEGYPLLQYPAWTAHGWM